MVGQLVFQPRQPVPAAYTYQPQLVANAPPPQSHRFVAHQPPQPLVSYSTRPWVPLYPSQLSVIVTQPVAPSPASVTVGVDTEYLNYTDPIIDNFFQYNQSQILSVDSSNYSQYEEQTFCQQQTQAYSQSGQVMQPMQSMRTGGQLRYQQQMQESYQQLVQPGMIDQPYEVIDAQYQAPPQQRQLQSHQLAITPIQLQLQFKLNSLSKSVSNRSLWL